jgi:very-short-patch-repair endonuclease
MSYKKQQVKGIKYSRMLKKNATIYERILYRALEDNDIWFKFQPFFFNTKKVYIPDFRLATNYNKLIIEIDGKNHKSQKRYDQDRTKWLNKNRNCIVLRFTNEEIEKNIDSVINKILKFNPLSKTKAIRNALPKEIYNQIIEFDTEFRNIVCL